LGDVQRHLADSPCATSRLVEFLHGDGSNADIPDQGQTTQPVYGFFEILLSKESQVSSGGDRRCVPRIWFALSTGDSCLDLREVIQKVVSDSANRLVGRVRTWSFTLDFRHE